jgi:hypothetical protein
MNKNILLPTLIAIVMISIFSYMSSGLSLIVTFVPGVILAYIFYFLFCYKSNPKSSEILPLYILGIGFQLLHFAEEHATDFDIHFGQLFGGEPYGHNLFVSFNMISYCMFLVGGYAIFKGFKPLMIIAMFFIAYGMLGNCIGHISYSIAAKGYFSGLYTSFLNLPLSIVMLRKLWRSRMPEMNKTKQLKRFNLAKEEPVNANSF